MKEMFWLNQSGSLKCPKPDRFLKNKLNEERKQEDSESQADIPICSAFSPSAKSLKVPKKYYKQHLLQEKRLSLDSGYAESNHSNESSPENDAENAENCTEDSLCQNHQVTSDRKLQELERLCDKCNRKMSVKFDFDKMESEGDPEAWVLFNCSMCTTPVADDGE